MLWVNDIFVICMYRYFVTPPLSKSWSLLFDLCCLSRCYMAEILQIWHNTLSNRSTVVWFQKLIKKLLPFYFQGAVNSTAIPPTTSSGMFKQLYSYPAQQVAEVIMFMTFLSVCQSCYIFFHHNSHETTFKNWIWWNFVVMKDILCRCVYLSEFFI